MSDAENKTAENSAQVEETNELEEFEEDGFDAEEVSDGVAFEFIDERETETPIDFERMERAVAKILADAGVERGRMEIVVLDAEPMRETNVQFLGERAPRRKRLGLSRRRGGTGAGVRLGRRRRVAFVRCSRRAPSRRIRRSLAGRRADDASERARIFGVRRSRGSANARRLTLSEVRRRKFSAFFELNGVRRLTFAFRRVIIKAKPVRSRD